MKIKSDEYEIHGKWILDGKSVVVVDETVKRIHFLRDNILEKISDGGWEVLYKDPGDGRFWECTYLHSELHGGGPPSLICISELAAEIKYNI